MTLSFLKGACGNCPNACSGNGSCGFQSTCVCNEGCTGADCSLRICSSSVSFATKPHSLDTAHLEVECAGVGTWAETCASKLESLPNIQDVDCFQSNLDSGDTLSATYSVTLRSYLSSSSLLSSLFVVSEYVLHIVNNPLLVHVAICILDTTYDDETQSMIDWANVRIGVSVVMFHGLYID